MSLKSCGIPTVYCGKGKIPKNTMDYKYTGKGTPFECMKKGYGAGMYTQHKKSLPANSLQQIKYVGETYEKKFKRRGIRTTTKLISHAGELSTEYLKELLQTVFMKKNGVVDRKAYNSCIVFLYRHGVGHIPKCLRI